MTITRNKRGANVAHINERIGARIRLRRQLVGMSQEKLGAALGMAFQQVQKYETGANRISAALLARAAEALDCPVSYFYGQGDEPAEIGMGGPDRQQVVSLLRHFNAIDDAGMRAAVVKLVKTAAGAKDDAA